MAIATETEKPSYFKRLLFARRVAQGWANKEKSNIAEWTTFNSPIKDYQFYFRDVFHQDFASFLQSRTKDGKDANVLNLMGQGETLMQLPLQAGLALTLGDGRSDGQKAIDQARNIDVVEGNILFIPTWKAMKKKMEMNGISSFGLILCRPDGGLWPEFIPYVEGLYYRLLNRAWDVLSPDGGVLLTELPAHLNWGGIYASSIQKWINTLQAHGIRARYEEEQAICLIKRNNFNPHLPVVRRK